LKDNEINPILNWRRNNMLEVLKTGKKIILIILAVSLIMGWFNVSTTLGEADSGSSFLDSLEQLLRDEANLFTGFDFLLHKTTTTVEEKVAFLTSFEDLLRRQTKLYKGFEDMLHIGWDCMNVEDQEKFLASFADLLDREAILYTSFENLIKNNWTDFNQEEKNKFLISFEDLLRRQTELFKSYEVLLKTKRGGISIEKTADKSVIGCEDTVTYTYTIKNWYKSKSIKNIVIIDDKLGTVVSGIYLKPYEIKIFNKSAILRETTCNIAKVMGEVDDLNASLVWANSIERCVLGNCGGGIPEPVQYGQYCESTNIEGNGVINIATKIEDRDIALDYNNELAGDGDIAIDAEHLLSEKASKLMRPVGNKTVPLSFYETTNMEYSGKTPLTGEKSLGSTQFDGGIGANIQETFSVNQLEKKQSSFFASTDPTTQIRNITQASNLMVDSPTHLIGIDTKNSFNGTWGTNSLWHQMLKTDVRDHQLFVGTFEAEKLIKFHEKPGPEKKSILCEGIDC
jgi:hypothetical protein